MNFFITGTDTEVGKTFFTALLLRIGIPHGFQPALVALGSLAFAIACYWCIERPIQRKMRPSRPRPHGTRRQGRDPGDGR